MIVTLKVTVGVIPSKARDDGSIAIGQTHCSYQYPSTTPG